MIPKPTFFIAQLFNPLHTLFYYDQRYMVDVTWHVITNTADESCKAIGTKGDNSSYVERQAIRIIVKNHKSETALS